MGDVSCRCRYQGFGAGGGSTTKKTTGALTTAANGPAVGAVHLVGGHDCNLRDAVVDKADRAAGLHVRFLKVDEGSRHRQCFSASSSPSIRVPLGPGQARLLAMGGLVCCPLLHSAYSTALAVVLGVQGFQSLAAVLRQVHRLLLFCSAFLDQVGGA